MGKTVHFHPVSLTVIRAAVIYCGWRFGKITQTSINADQTRATYVAEVTLMPKEYADKSGKQQRRGINNCFAKDIRAITVWTTRRGKTYVSLETDIRRASRSDDQADDQVDEQEPEAQAVEFPF